MRFTIINILVLFILAAPNIVFAITKEECKRQIITAMENAKKLGAREEEWGNIAARDCESKLDNAISQADKGMRSEISDKIILFILLGLIVVYIAKRIFDKVLHKEVESLVAEELQRFQDDSNSWRETSDLEQLAKLYGKDIDFAKEKMKKLDAMTIKEICLETDSSERRVKAILRRIRQKCADFDGSVDSPRQQTKEEI